MTKRRTKKNLFGFGSKRSSGCARKSSLTFAQAKSAAFQAGQKSGDTGAWESWKCGKGLQDRGGPVLKQLESEYRRGVEVGEKKVESKKRLIETKKLKAAAKKAKKASAKKLVSRVKGTAIYKVGDHFEIQGGDSEFDSVRDARRFIESNPKKFDACVKKVAASAKKSGKPTNAYAVCTAAGTRNPGWKITQGKLKGAVTREGKRFKATVTSQYGTQHHMFDSLKGAQAWTRTEVFNMAGNPGALATGVASGLAAHVTQHVAKQFKAHRGKVTKRRPNPETEAAVAYEQFTGFEPTQVTEIHSSEHVHEWVWGVGQLIAICVERGDRQFPVISKGWSYNGPWSDIFGKPKKDQDIVGWELNPRTKLEDITWLTCSETPKASFLEQAMSSQLYINGGDQKLDIKGMAIFEPSDIRDNMIIGEITRVWYRQRKTFEAKGKEQVDFYHDLGKEGSKEIRPILEYKPRDPSLHVVGGRYTIAKPESQLGGVSPGIVG